MNKKLTISDVAFEVIKSKGLDRIGSDDYKLSLEVYLQCILRKIIKHSVFPSQVVLAGLDRSEAWIKKKIKGKRVYIMKK